MSISQEQIRAVKERVLALVRNNPEMSAASPSVSIAFLPEGTGIKVSLSRPVECASPLPSEIDSVPVRIEIVGSATKFE